MTGTQPPPKLELLLVNFKLDGPAMYLSWSYQIMGALARRGLDGYVTVTEEEKEPLVKMSSEWKAWRATHTFFVYLVSQLHGSINCTTTVDEIQNVNDIWEKFKLSRR